MFRNIKESKIFKISKKRHLEYIENIVALMPGHVYWKDKNGVLLGCNDAQAKDIGLKSRYDIVGLTAYDTLPKELADKITEIDTEVINSGVTKTVEEILVQPDGEQSIWLSQKVPLYDKKGEITGLVGISFDITNQKKTEQALLETQNKLEGMTLVSAAIAHELRTPLATLSMGVGSLKEYFPSLLEAYRLAEQAALPVVKIKPRNFSLLKNVLNSMESVVRASFTFIDMLLMNVSPAINVAKNEIFSINQCIDDALSRYPFQSNELQSVHWDKTNEFQVNGNVLLVTHVLFNLLKNALYYIAKAQKGEIFIWLEKRRPYNCLCFKDTGTGISNDILPFIFDRFFSKTYHGAGIGLTFCKQTMESLGGKITCESEEGVYTQFTLLFPSIEK